MVTYEPKVYCGTYAKYNNGNLFGEWMNLNDYSDYDEFYKACKELHKDEDDPEFMFQDYEDFPSVYYNESFGRKSFDKIKEFAECDNQDAFMAYLENVNENADYDEFEQNYCGEWGSKQEFAEETFNECFDVPDNISYYIDYEKFARDIFIDSYVSVDAPNYNIYVFYR